MIKKKVRKLTYPLALELKDAEEVNRWDDEHQLHKYYTFIKINTHDLWCFKRKTTYNQQGQPIKKK